MSDQNHSVPSRTTASTLGPATEKGYRPEYIKSFAPKRLGSIRTTDNSVIALVTSRLPNQGGGVKATINQENIPMSDSTPVDLLLAKLSEQQQILYRQHETLKSTMDDDKATSRALEHSSSSSSAPITAASNSPTTSDPAPRPVSTSPDTAGNPSDEIAQLKLQLAEAQAKISRLEEESQSENVKPDTPAPERQVQNGFAASAMVPGTVWVDEDASHEGVSALAPVAPNRVPSRTMWYGNRKGPINSVSADVTGGYQWVGQRPNYNHGHLNPNSSYGMVDGYRSSDRLTPDPDFLMRSATGRRGSRLDTHSRYATPAPFNGPYGGYNQSVGQYDMSPGQTAGPGNMAQGASPGPGLGMFQGYQSQPMPTSLSPHATEFTSTTGWKNEAIATEGQTYLPPTEPLNYRRLLDRNVNCNWKYIVDKIVCNNDQQASIFLQQKLKVGTTEQKFDIVEAIVAQAYPLMVNRFGNFLVQRCFEHGTPEQVIKIAHAIRGNTLVLSMDSFGCHVVQKAFDSVPEEYKALMVHELLQRIPETVIHRYACHVWQKLFELRWSDTPPQIMQHVNEALRGMWHEVALGETGSLVVQNIFENCLEEDKRQCIEEVLANIDIVAHGQFGNWCIQHICEHGAPADRSRAIDHVIRFAAEYSTDQYASKVVEKCLKIGGVEFLSRYLDRVCEGRIDRPRIPLIDIASDQYGNYLIQYILTHANPQHRDIVAAHIRKHMVSLRGSKFGSRVGMLCTNPASATRPGPAMGPAMGGGRMLPGSRYSGPGYR